MTFGEIKKRTVKDGGCKEKEMQTHEMLSAQQ